MSADPGSHGKTVGTHPDILGGVRAVKPKELPEIQRHLSKLVDMVATLSPDAKRLVEWESRTFREGGLRLIFVSEDMTALLCRVAHTVPDGVSLEDVPRPLRGLAVFEHPVIGTDASNPDQEIEVHGQMWGPVRIKERGKPRYGISIGTIGHTPEAHQLRTMGYVPLGRADWMDDEAIEVVDRDFDSLPVQAVENPDTFKASTIEDRRLFVALMTLMRQERHVETTTWRPMSKGAKRRLGKDAEVTVVSLRRVASEGSSKAEKGEGRKWKVRTWVDPYFRMQPYGPNRSLRRLQLIDGYMAGPPDAPLSTRTRVWSLKR